jgi:hypothetical protein
LSGSNSSEGRLVSRFGLNSSDKGERISIFTFKAANKSRDELGIRVDGGITLREWLEERHWQVHLSTHVNIVGEFHFFHCLADSYGGLHARDQAEFRPDLELNGELCSISHFIIVTAKDKILSRSHVRSRVSFICGSHGDNSIYTIIERPASIFSGWVMHLVVSVITPSIHLKLGLGLSAE